MCEAMRWYGFNGNREKGHSVLLLAPWLKCSRVLLAICTRLPKCFPDKQETSIILFSGLSSNCSQEQEKVGVWRAMGRDPKFNKDDNIQYLLFQESLPKNDYRSGVHVAGEWVITSLKTSVQMCWFLNKN